jgi:subtilisin-like proprotein convertase family protein
MLHSNNFVYFSSLYRLLAQIKLTWRGSLFIAILAVCTFQLVPWHPISQAARQPTKASAVQRSAYRSPGWQHKVRVTDAMLAQKLRARGGRLLAQYEQSWLISIDDQILAPLPEAGIELSDEENLILLNSGILDTTDSELQENRVTQPRTAVSSSALHLVQFVGPIKPAWYHDLLKTGVVPIAYVPHNTYLVYGNVSQLSEFKEWAATSPYVQWDGTYQEAFKLDPSISELRTAKGFQAPDNLSDLFALQLVNDPTANQETLQIVNSLKLEPAKSQYQVLNYLNVIVRMPLSVVEKTLVGRPDIISVMRYREPVKNDERQNIILTGNIVNGQPNAADYLNYLSTQGLTQAQFSGSNFAVNVSDSGIDNATTSPHHFALYVGGNIASSSRIAYAQFEGTPNQNSTNQGCDGHGTLNAHIIGGFVPSGDPFNLFPHADGQALRYGLGVAPFVRLGSTIIFDPTRYTFPNLINVEAKAYQNGARISSNSWGAPANGAYTIDAQAFDALVRDAQPNNAPFPAQGNQEQVIVFSAGNGAVSGSIGAPGSAKNVITVGAAEGVNAFNGADGCNIADDQANHANDVANISSRGPTSDGRNKPDLVAPGTHITGGVYQAQNPGPFGAAAACYLTAAFGITTCGGAGGGKFFPNAQQFYTASSGTSHAVPAVAGAAALVRQRFLNAGLNAPSPAMTKAALMNSARYLTGNNANDSLWSNNQGMGEVNLTNFFGLFAQPTILRDQQAADIFTSSGQQRSFTGTIADSSKPFRITLAWTDAPGSTVGNAFVNNLDLEVTLNGQTYKGNVYQGEFSIAGGLSDTRNNVESITLPAGLTGSYVIIVKATNIAGDGVPNFGGPLDQDFALVIANATQTTQAVINGGTATLVTEACLPANNVVDPAETVTMSLSLQNIGTASTSNLVANLQPSSGVINPGAAQTYGVLTAGGPAVSRNFTFTTVGTCGGAITATLDLQDGATNLGTVSFTINLGQLMASTVNFNSASALIVPNGAPATTSGPATPYASNISVSGVTGIVSKVTVTLNGLTHTNPDDLDILLVGPTGQKVLLVSDCGGNADLNNLSFTLDDTAANLPNASVIGAGNFHPTNYGDGDIFNLPAPSGPYAEPSLAVFNNLNPNGTWNLYLMDDADGDTGALTGWRLNITTINATCCNTNNCGLLTVNPATIPTGNIGNSYSQTFTQTGGTGPVTFGLVGALPAGLSFSPTGLLSGTPAQAGSFPITVSVIDAQDCLSQRAYTLSIGNLAITTQTLPTGKLNQPYTQNLQAAGGTSPYVWSLLSGALPPGLVLSNAGSVFGTPTQHGTFNFTARVTDAQSVQVQKAFSLQINRNTTKADFDGDAKTDLSTWRGSNGTWYTLNSSSNTSFDLPWGAGYAPYFDVPVPGDYDGDGKTDHAIWRGGDSIWYIRKSSNGQAILQPWGASYAPYFDVPTPGDYDGDGKTDLAIWRPTDGTFYVLKSADGSFLIQPWGSAGDTPTPGDYDGDGKTDFAYWRPSNGTWFIKNSSGGNQIIPWGAGYAPYFDAPVQADYDGDGKTDLAIWRGQDSLWYIRKSSDLQSFVQPWGAKYAPYNDIPIPGDYDGDGKADIAVWRSTTATWFVRRSSNGSFLVQTHGQPDDSPVPAYGVK